MDEKGEFTYEAELRTAETPGYRTPEECYARSRKSLRKTKRCTSNLNSGPDKNAFSRTPAAAEPLQYRTAAVSHPPMVQGFRLR